MHEDLTREQHVEGASDRSFAFVFAAAFAVVAALPLTGGGAPRWWAAVVSAMFVALGVMRPSLLAPLNKAWMRLGLMMGHIISPVALGIAYYFVLTPVGLLMRLQGKDTLRLKADKSASTYWRPRDPPGPPPQSMNRQF